MSDSALRRRAREALRTCRCQFASSAGRRVVISECDLDALARVAFSEVQIFRMVGVDQLAGGAAAVVDTVINRVAHPAREFPGSIRKVIDSPAQFSAINGLGTWSALPKPDAGFRQIVKRHVEARACGRASLIRGATHFLNPNTATASARASWGRNLVENPVARYGDIGGKFVHHHGFPEGYGPPCAYAVEYRGQVAWFEGSGAVRFPDTTRSRGRSDYPRSQARHAFGRSWSALLRIVSREPD